MISLLATIATILASAMLIRLDWVPVRTSKALLIPFLWLSIASSRPVSNWITFDAPVNASDQYIDGSPLDRNVLTLLLVLAMIVLSKRRVQVATIVRANTPLVIFLAYCGISMLWADYPFVVLKRWIRALADVAMVMIIITERHPVHSFKRLLMWIGAILIPLSILFTRFFPSLGRSYTAAGAPMWTGVATDKNALGALCMLTGVVLLSRWLTTFGDTGGRQRIRQLITTGTLLAMAMYLLVMIDSKTALASFLMAGILVFMQRCGSVFRRPWLLTIVIVGMVSITYSILFLGLGSSSLAKMGRDTSLTGRTQVWDIVLPFAVNPWIGAGYENFWIGERLRVIIHAIGAGLNQAHNGYIEIYLNIGWVGLMLLAAVIVGGYANIMNNLREDAEISGIKLAFYFICLVYNFTEAAFKIMSPVWIVFLWATMAVPKIRSADSTRLGSVRPLAFFAARERPTPSRGISVQEP